MTNWNVVAAALIGVIAEYGDTRFLYDDEDAASDRVEVWAGDLGRANIAPEFLREGLSRAYSGQQRPGNPLGALLHEAREARKDSRKGEVLRELAPSFSDESLGSHGYAIPEAYQVDDAINLTCPQCGARPQEVCEDSRGVRKIPHSPLLALAYRTNNREGRRKHEERQKHLEHHRKTFKPSWSTK